MGTSSPVARSPGRPVARSPGRPVARLLAERQALGWRRTYERPDEVVLEPPEHSLQDGVAPDLLFGLSPDGKVGKNRLHLDLRPDDQHAEVDRLLALGASLADVGQSDDVPWVVMADPEGNEFCVLNAFTAEQVEQLAAIRAARRQAPVRR